MPPGPAGQYEVAQNQDYIVALSQLKAAVDTIKNSPLGTGDTNLVNQTSTSAGAAKVAVTKIMGSQVDQSFHTETQVRRLLEEPIIYVELLLTTGPKDALNGAGKAFCAQFAAISGKYPFNPKSNEDLSIDQLDSIFEPRTGALWKFYETNLKQFLPEPGPPYVPVTGAR